jgi:hypothetical protein
MEKEVFGPLKKKWEDRKKALGQQMDMKMASRRLGLMDSLRFVMGVMEIRMENAPRGIEVDGGISLTLMG